MSVEHYLKLDSEPWMPSDEARRELAEAEEALRFVSHDDGYEGYRSQPTNVIGYTGVGGVWFPYPDHLQAAVRRALERKP